MSTDREARGSVTIPPGTRSLLADDHRLVPRGLRIVLDAVGRALRQATDLTILDAIPGARRPRTSVATATVSDPLPLVARTQRPPARRRRLR